MNSSQELQSILLRDPKWKAFLECKKCPSFATTKRLCKFRPIPPFPQTQPPSQTGRLMILADRPLEPDFNTALPFSGSIGAVVHNALRAANINPSAVYFSLVAKCGDRDNPGRKPSEAELTTCRYEWLLPEIAEYDPDTIIVLGQRTHEAVVRPIAPARSFVNGQVLIAPRKDPSLPKRIVVAMFHPSYYSYSNRNFDEFTHAMRDVVERVNHLRVSGRVNPSKPSTPTS